jgi:hypothetical protein
MPRTKNITQWSGTVAEEVITYETHWVQVVGDLIVRCDHAAKEKGFGSWTTMSPTRSASWYGSGDLVPGVDPVNWIREDNVEDIYCEVDYS